MPETVWSGTSENTPPPTQRERGNNWMTTQEIADEVNERDRYRKRDGSAVTAFQIHGRTRKYGHIFDRRGSQVRVREPGS